MPVSRSEPAGQSGGVVCVCGRASVLGGCMCWRASGRMGDWAGVMQCRRGTPARQDKAGSTCSARLPLLARPTPARHPAHPPASECTIAPMDGWLVVPLTESMQQSMMSAPAAAAASWVATAVPAVSWVCTWMGRSGNLRGWSGGRGRGSNDDGKVTDMPAWRVACQPASQPLACFGSFAGEVLQLLGLRALDNTRVPARPERDAPRGPPPAAPLAQGADEHGSGARLQQARHVLDGQHVDTVVHHFLCGTINRQCHGEVPGRSAAKG